jgi:hypothetical protein
MSDGEGDAAEEPKPMIDRRREPSAHIQWYWRAQGHWKSHDCSRDDAFANGRELVAKSQSELYCVASIPEAKDPACRDPGGSPSASAIRAMV